MMGRAAAVCLGAMALAGCTGMESVSASASAGRGDAERGRAMLSEYGCVACHQIPGLRNAAGRVGPPLTALGQRRYLAGRVANTPENLAQWIHNPQSIDPETLMPVTGADLQASRDMAAYLGNLR